MILLIESGSSKTEWRYISSPNEAYQRFHSLGINPYYQTAEEIQASQKDVLSQLSTLTVEEIYYYGTGITDDSKREIIRNWLSPYFSGVKTIQVDNDLIAAARSLCGDDSGIACILGTGSNSGFFDGESIKEQIPPLGFWLGDEGSGGHLGKLLILAYLHHELPQDLRDLFVKRYGELNRLEILSKAYQGEYPNRWFAGFSKFLFDHRKHPFCYQLIEHAFQEFIRLYVCKYAEVETQKIHFTGSIAFYYSDILKQVLRKNRYLLGNISETPMAGLTLYHKSKRWTE
ncbi:N-acetylglucosamine kinase [Aquirufa ecclesiirivi]|uniref:N-acetylglucosamine kinase n=1 Tax=Aquirufa ecclesiirivi TaxID=2715124 RepID=UPI0022A83543|nr:N-acetylglucosamine kinase [Aquirufa ecclesiirivi]MCZ2473419.1 N-acetylglucosamine kinase [Aquirufa ecclesiirivi]